MSGSLIRGWRSAAARAGLAPTSLRRLVARGEIPMRQVDGNHVFESADLDALRAQTPENRPPDARSFERPRQRESVPKLIVPKNDHAASGEGLAKSTSKEAITSNHPDVAAIRLAADLERAEAGRVTAEIERLHALHARDEVLRVQREEHRVRTMNAIVARTIAATTEPARSYVEEPLRQRLSCLSNLGDRLAVGAAIARAVEQARTHADASQRAAAERAAQQRRANRASSLVANLANELRGFGWSPAEIEHAADVAYRELAKLDDFVLYGAAWPSYAARLYACAALNLHPPEPFVWQPDVGWRRIQPGE